MTKKILLFLMISILASGINGQENRNVLLKSKKSSESKMPTRALAENDQYILGYASTSIPQVSFGISEGTSAIKAYVEFPATSLNMLVGNKITKLIIHLSGGAAGANSVTDASIDILNDKDAAPVYTQSVSFTGTDWDEITLTTPYEIEAGKNLYIGYSGTIKGFPISVDLDILSGQNSWLSIGGEWINMTTDYNANISVLGIVEGDNLPQLDLALLSAAAPEYVKTGAPFVIQGQIKNEGVQTVQSFDVVYQIGNEVPITKTFNNKNVANYSKTTFMIDDVVATQEGIFELKVYTSNPNGGEDVNHANDTIRMEFSSASKMFTRKIVAEEGTGTWCRFCPRGAVAMAYMKEKYEDSFIGIAVHNGDPMVNSAYDKGLKEYLTKGYPSAVVNRRIELDPGDIEKAYLLEGPFSTYGISLSGDFVDANRKKINAKTKLETSFDKSDADLAITFVVIENNVTGTVSGYAQSNAYSGLGVEMGGYEFLPDPVPAADMVYQDVARGIFNSFKGIAGSVPSELVAGQAYEYNYTLTLPAAVKNIDEIEIIALLLDRESGEILNAEKIASSEIKPVGIEQEFSASQYMTVYKNNSDLIVELDTDKVQSATSVDLLNAQGQLVYTVSVADVNSKIVIPVSSMHGVYLVKVDTDKGLVVKKVIL